MNLAIAAVILTFAACAGGCGGGGSITYTTEANAETTNASTQVQAKNIIFDNTKTSLSATNIQGAIEEIAPKSQNLSTLMVGTWDSTKYGSVSVETGKITFQTNGQYTDAYGTGKWSVDSNDVLTLVFPSGANVHGYFQKISSNRIDVITDYGIMILKR